MKWISILKNCFQNACVKNGNAARMFPPDPLVTSPSQDIVVSSSRGACAQIRKQMPGGVLLIFTAQKVDTLVAVLAHYVRVHVSRSGKLTAQSRSRCTGTALAIRSRSQISRPQTPDPSSHQKSREGPLTAPMNLHTIYAREFYCQIPIMWELAQCLIVGFGI